MSVAKKVKELDNFYKAWHWADGLTVVGTHDPVDAFYEFVEYVKREWSRPTHSQAQRDVQTSWALSLQDFISFGHRAYVSYNDLVSDEELNMKFHKHWWFGRVKVFYLTWEQELTPDTKSA